MHEQYPKAQNCDLVNDEQNKFEQLPAQKPGAGHEQIMGGSGPEHG